MKKYYPVDFDEKGNAVLGNAKNTPTSNGFIPTTWAPGGEAGNGIKSITISPAITTTPALESLFPIYYEDLTEEQKQSVVVLRTTSDDFSTGGTYNVTITPTPNWYVYDPDRKVFGGKGESITFENVNGESLTTTLVFMFANETNVPPAEYIRIHLSIENQ